MRHLVGVVIKPYDGFPLLYAGQYYHQSSVCHHQIQVVFSQVKVHRLAGGRRKNKPHKGVITRSKDWNERLNLIKAENSL